MAFPKIDENNKMIMTIDNLSITANLIKET